MIQELKNKKVIVTGGAGFIYSHIIDELIKRNCEVIVVDDLTTGTLKNLKQNAGKFKFNQSSVHNCNFAEYKNVDVIFHGAALNLINSVNQPYRDLYVNAGGTVNILNYIKENPKIVLINASTGSIYGEPIVKPQTEEHPKNPTSPYGISKLAAEMYVEWFTRQYGLKTVSLRYYNIIGPRQRYDNDGGVVPIFVRRMLKGEQPIIEGDGSQKRCFTSIDDVINANIMAYENCNKYGGAYNIATKESTTISYLAEIIWGFYNQRLKPIYAPPRIGDIHEFSPAIDKAKADFGWEPHYKLKQILPSIINWMKHELGLDKNLQ